MCVQEAQRAREEGERRRKERGYDRRHRDRERYRDRYRRVCIMIKNLFSFCLGVTCMGSVHADDLHNIPSWA